jgi:hypothetical protein
MSEHKQADVDVGRRTSRLPPAGQAVDLMALTSKAA